MPLLERAAILNPFGPIFGKELRTTARRKRSYGLRVFFLAALLLTLLGVWAESGASRSYNYGVAARTQAQARLGGEFFLCFSIFSVIAMGVIAPVLTSTAISAERLARTLPVLLMTPITAWQIVSGKLFSRLLVALTLLGLSLPVLALVRLLGGVELGQMVAVVCVCVATALSNAALGLFFSTFVNRAYAAILLSYAAIGFLYLFVPFALIVGLGLQERKHGWIIAAINPMFSAVMAAEPSGWMRRVGWVPCVVGQLALTVVLVGATAMLIRRIARRAGERPAAIDPSEYVPIATVAPEPVAGAGDGGTLEGAAVVFPTPRPPQVLPYSGKETRVRRCAPPRDVSDNPVLWRETRRPLTAGRWQAVVATVCCVGLLLTFYAILGSENALDDKDAQIAFAVTFNGLLWLLVSVLSATAIAQEKESDTWTLLLAAPLSGWSIVVGKVLGLCRRLMWPMILIAAHFLLFTVTGVIGPATFVLILWVMVTFNAVWIATGVYLSLKLRLVTVAVILNLLIAVVAYAAVPVTLLIAGELLGRRGGSGENWAEQVCWYLPYYYLGNGTDKLNQTPWPGYVQYGQYGQNDWTRRFWMPGDFQATAQEFLSIAFMVGCAHLALATTLISIVAARFDGIVGRAAQKSTKTGSRPGVEPTEPLVAQGI